MRQPIGKNQLCFMVGVGALGRPSYKKSSGACSKSKSDTIGDPYIGLSLYKVITLLFARQNIWDERISGGKTSLEGKK